MTMLGHYLIHAGMEQGANMDEVYETGEAWLRRAARRGSMFARGLLGDFLLDCHTDEASHQEGERHLRVAAASGDRVAMRNLGICLYWGEGVAANEDEGLAWLRRSAELGDWLARDILRDM